MAHLIWAGVVLVLGLYALTIWLFYARKMVDAGLKLERDVVELRKASELEFVAARKLFLEATGALESRIRDLEMKVN